MGKGKDHIKNTKAHQRYLKDEMTSAERHAFEKRLLDDEFEQEALEGLSQLSEKELGADLDTLANRLGKRVNPKKEVSFWRIAASFSLLVGSALVIYFLLDSPVESEIAMDKSQQDEASMARKEAEPQSDAVIAEKPKEENTRDEIQEMAEAPTEVAEDVIVEAADQETRPEEILSQASESEDNQGYYSEEQVAKLQEIESESLPAISEGDVPLDIETDDSAPEEVVKRAVAPSQARQSSYLLQTDNTRTITGTISSQEDDEVLPGVNIILKGSAIGTVSDIDGQYEIEVPADEDATLVFSYIGFNSTEVSVEEQQEIDVNIEPDVNALSEIVVTGYSVKSEKSPGEYTYTPPEPKEGASKFRQYVRDHLQYPKEELANAIRGTVKLRFNVDFDGTVSNIEVIKSLGPSFDREAVRLLEQGPPWKPALENDVAVSRSVTLKIRFRPPR